MTINRRLQVEMNQQLVSVLTAQADQLQSSQALEALPRHNKAVRMASDFQAEW